MTIEIICTKCGFSLPRNREEPSFIEVMHRRSPVTIGNQETIPEQDVVMLTCKNCGSARKIYDSWYPGFNEKEK